MSLPQDALYTSVKAQVCRKSVVSMHAKEVAAYGMVTRDLAQSRKSSGDIDTLGDLALPPATTRLLPGLPDDVVKLIFAFVAQEATCGEIPNVRLVNKHMAKTVPEISPRWPVRPLVEVRPSSVHGRGVFSTRAYEKNEVIGRHKGKFVVGRSFPSEMVTNHLTFQLKKDIEINGARAWCIMVPPNESPPASIQPFFYINHACSSHANCVFMEVKSTHALNQKVILSNDLKTSMSDPSQLSSLRDVVRTSVYVFGTSPIKEGEELLTNYNWYRFRWMGAGQNIHCRHPECSRKRKRERGNKSVPFTV